MSYNRYDRFCNKWNLYNNCLELGIDWSNWANAAGLMHESGHNLSLNHTILTPGGDCCNYCDDYCDNTPTIPEVIALDGINPCALPAWNNPDHSNNIMEYSGVDAITPDQLGRVH